MKKTTIITLMFVIASLVISGCSNAPAETSDNQDENSDDATTEDMGTTTMSDMTTTQAEVTTTAAEATTTQEEVTTTESTATTVEMSSDIPPLAEWCEAGMTYDLSTADGAVASEIVGIETYEGKEFCKGTQKTNAGGIEVETTYYFTYEAQEMWVISTVMGQTTKSHIVDGELV